MGLPGCLFVCHLILLLIRFLFNNNEKRHYIQCHHSLMDILYKDYQHILQYSCTFHLACHIH